MLNFEFVLLLCLAAVPAQPAGIYKTSLEQKVTEAVCRMQANATLKASFQQEVKEQNYLESNETLKALNRYASVALGSLSSARCYSKCKNATVSDTTWCVYVYHPTEQVKVCLDEHGVLEETPVATALGLGSLLAVKKECEGSPLATGCLWITNTPIFLQRAYMVCTIRSETCFEHSFLEVIVDASKENVRITELPESPITTALGERNVLKCSAVVSTSIGYIEWRRSATTYYPIAEDPYCRPDANNSCYNDTTVRGLGAKLQRVRMYSVSEHYSLCNAVLTNMISYLIIDNTTTGDFGTYSCSARTSSFYRYGQKNASGSVELELSDSYLIASTSASRNETKNPMVATTDQFVVPSDQTRDRQDTAQSRNMDLKLHIVIPAVLAIIFFIAVVGIVMLIMNQKRRKRISKRVEAKNAILYDKEFASIAQLSSVQKTIQHPTLVTDPWEFPREKLHVMQSKVLGKGAFGKVYKAEADGIIPADPERNIVAVKMIKDNAQSQKVSSLFDEIELMKKIKPHENILNLLGYCTTPGGPVYLIIEFAMYGSLRHFLNSCEEAVLKLNQQPLIAMRQSRLGSISSTSSAHHLLGPGIQIPENVEAQLNSTFCSQDSGYGDEHQQDSHRLAQAKVNGRPTAHTIVPISSDYINCKGLIYMEDVHNFAFQIASGLKHLETMEIVHCDLAARNILISEGFVLKISDFGMARDISGKEYYRKSPKGRVPVKWTAPEALEEHLYTFKSDIWSFGIILWEIYTYGHSPYPDIEIQAWEPFIQLLKGGLRPHQPPGCPEFSYRLMERCWKLNPDERPSAEDLMHILSPQCLKGECDTAALQNSCGHIEDLSQRYVLK